jgi:hypothetical protein
MKITSTIVILSALLVSSQSFSFTIKLKNAPTEEELDFTKIDRSGTVHARLESIYQEAIRGISFEGIDKVPAQSDMQYDRNFQSRKSFILSALTYKICNKPDGQKKLKDLLDSLYPELNKQTPYRARPVLQAAIRTGFIGSVGVGLFGIALGVREWLSGRSLLYPFGQCILSTVAGFFAGKEMLAMIVQGEYYGLKCGAEITRDIRLYEYFKEAYHDVSARGAKSTYLEATKCLSCE